MINVQSKVGGRYKFTRLKADTREVQEQTPWIKNLITDNGLDLMEPGGYTHVCAVGTGNTAPSFSDTELSGFVASTGSSNRSGTTQTSTSPFYMSQISIFEFSAGSATGNISEVGVGASPANLFSRALITDESGNPITITVLSDEILRVEYELRVEIPETDNTGTFDLDGTTYTWTARASELNSNAWWDPTHTSSKVLQGKPFKISDRGSRIKAYEEDMISMFDNRNFGFIYKRPSAITIENYTSGDFSSSAEFTWGPSKGNFATGIGHITFENDFNRLYLYQIGFSPKIPKTDLQEFKITVSHSWGRK